MRMLLWAIAGDLKLRLLLNDAVNRAARASTLQLAGGSADPDDDDAEDSDQDSQEPPVDYDGEGQ